MNVETYNIGDVMMRVPSPVKSKRNFTDEESGDSANSSRKSWRKGKWTEEEETYTMKLIEAFIAGVLPLAQGTTLRSFLSEKLCCDPMRITKKFAGSNGIGKQVFSPCQVTDRTEEARMVLEREINELRRIFTQKVENSRNCSFPTSAKALAFSAKLQLQVQHAPLLTQEYNASSVISGFRNSHPTLPWVSRFDASNTNSISKNTAFSDISSTSRNPLIGDKRSMSLDACTLMSASSSPMTQKLSSSSDLDASKLLLNFFKANNEKDSSDLDSDSNESLDSDLSSKKRKINSGSMSLSSGVHLEYYDSSGGLTTGSSSGSGSDDSDSKSELLNLNIPF